MTDQTSTTASTFAQRFVERLRELPRTDLAVLKRNAGRSIAQSRQAVGVFYRLFPNISDDRDEEVYFLVATLFGLNPPGHGKATKGNFGSAMRQLKGPLSETAADTRMKVLLDSQFDFIHGFAPGSGELAYRLRQCVKLLASHKIGLDWPELIEDLRLWMHPGKSIQKKWARSYFSGAPTEALATADITSNSDTEDDTHTEN